MAVQVISTTKAPGAVGLILRLSKPVISSLHPVRSPSTRKRAKSLPERSSAR